MSNYGPLRELYLARLREFYRQPARIFWVYGFPTIMAVCLGIAFKSRPPEPVQVDVVRSPTSGSVEEAFLKYDDQASKSKKPGLIYKAVTQDEADYRLKTGKTPLVVEVNPSGVVTYRYDPTRPEATAARSAIDNILQRAAGRPDPVSTRDEEVKELGSRYIDFLIPGLLGLNTMGGGLWGIGFLLVNFRLAKLLKRFMATPMPRRDFLLAILGARLTFLLPDLAVLLSMGYFFFQMPIRGNLGLVILVDVVGALAFAGIGLLVGSRASSTEAASGLMNLVMLPMWLFSGVFFSSDRFPQAAQPFIQALPLTQLNSALRRVILEGASLVDVSLSLAILAAWAIVTFLIALKIFKWT